MFLKQRNFGAFVLILFAAFCWCFGQNILEENTYKDGYTEETATSYTYEETTYTPAISSEYEETSNQTMETSSEWTTSESTQKEYSTNQDYEEADSNMQRVFAIILILAAITAAALSIIIFWQQSPILGPDGVGLLSALLTMAYSNINIQYLRWDYYVSPNKMMLDVVGIIVLLIVIRELYGWMKSKIKLSWCLIYRIGKGFALPQATLCAYVLFIVISLAGCGYCTYQYLQWHMFYQIPAMAFLVAAVLSFVCLWRYGSDLNHFKKQLENYQNNKPITVGDGAFSQTEEQLLDVQVKHEEAVRTAVNSERFKVELISNVSHDLRTPLTSILGYGELLKKEELSPQGREQLNNLNLKASYMNDLVEALFELTKVSSGVLECRREEIDLIKLLEQTIGLFDDQLADSGLCVRRDYIADSILVITDGARMHQVFANLLGNAIKYALAGTRIYVDVEERDNSFYIRMVNTASYEMDFKADEIVQRFARGDKARSTKGSGLGLAIAQTYTESVGGSFHVVVDGDQFSAIVELPKFERNS